MAEKSKWLIGVICLTLISAEAWPAAGWTSYGAVIELSPTTSGRFLVKLNVVSNPSGCKNKQWFYCDYIGTGADHMFRALLIAVTSGKKERVYVTGSCDLDGNSEISSVNIIPYQSRNSYEKHRGKKHAL
jgi:hypothetical protein